MASISAKKQTLPPQSYVYLHVIFWSTLLLRLFYLWNIQANLLVEDAGQYFQMGLLLLHDEVFTPFWPPGLPIVLAGFMRLFGENPFVSSFSMLIYYGLFMWGIWKSLQYLQLSNLSHECFLIIGVFPAFIHHAVVPLTHLPVATYLVLLFLWTISYLRTLTSRYLIGIGILLTLLVLTRPSSLLLAIVLPLYLWYKTQFRWTSITLPLIIFTLGVGMWEMHVYHMTHRFIWINEANSRNFFLGNNPYTDSYKTWWLGSHHTDDHQFLEYQNRILALPDSEQGKAYTQLAISHIKTNPVDFLLRSFNRFRVFWAFDTFTGATYLQDYQGNRWIGVLFLLLDAVCYCLILFGAIFLFPFVWLRKQFYTIPLILIGAFTFLYAFPYWLAFSHPTYHLPILSFILLIALIGYREMKYTIAPKGLCHISWSSIPLWGRKWILTLGAFGIYIQLEWIFRMLLS